MFKRIARGASLRKTYLSKRVEGRNKKAIIKSATELQARNINTRS